MWPWISTAKKPQLVDSMDLVSEVGVYFTLRADEQTQTSDAIIQVFNNKGFIILAFLVTLHTNSWYFHKRYFRVVDASLLQNN